MISNERIQGMIKGINPSISSVVYLLNMWGVKTYSSHAGYYPGDREEQEFWAQKWGIKDEYGIDIDGPLTVLGCGFELPYIYVIVQERDYKQFIKLLVDDWKLEKPNGRLKHDTATQRSFKLVYKNKGLIEFGKTWNKLYEEVLDYYQVEEMFDILRMNKASLNEVNQLIMSNLPYSVDEFNQFRDLAIIMLRNSILESFSKFNNKRYKNLVDNYILSLNEREGFPIDGFFV